MLYFILSINSNKNRIIIVPFKNFNDNRIIIFITIKDYSNIQSKHTNRSNERMSKQKMSR